LIPIDLSMASGNLHGCAVAKTILLPSKFTLFKDPNPIAL